MIDLDRYGIAGYDLPNVSPFCSESGPFNLSRRPLLARWKNIVINKCDLEGCYRR